mgnify:CR=1 FL=1
MQIDFTDCERGDLFRAKATVQSQQEIQPFDRSGVPIKQPQFIELNTVPGMTDHSLVPMAAAARGGNSNRTVSFAAGLGGKLMRTVSFLG